MITTTERENKREKTSERERGMQVGRETRDERQEYELRTHAVLKT